MLIAKSIFAVLTLIANERECHSENKYIGYYIYAKQGQVSTVRNSGRRYVNRVNAVYFRWIECMEDTHLRMYEEIVCTTDLMPILHGLAKPTYVCPRNVKIASKGGLKVDIPCNHQFNKTTSSTVWCLV